MNMTGEKGGEKMKGRGKKRGSIESFTLDITKFKYHIQPVTYK